MRQAMRELVQVTTMWFGLGDPGDTGDPRRDGRYLTVQTLAAIALGALAAAARSGLSDRALPAAWPPAYLLLVLPLAIAVARRPVPSLPPLAAALPSGAAVLIAAVLLLPVDGFWWWFAAAAAGALVAGGVFGLLRREGRPGPAH